MRTSPLVARLCAAAVLAASAMAADGPHVPPGQAQSVVAEHLAAPKHYNVFYGKRDRQHLTGLWKLKWEWNYLTKDWMRENMVRKRGRSTGTWLKDGVRPPYKEIAPRGEHLDVAADVSGWWDVLVPSPWQERMPYEQEASRPICDQYLKHRNRYVFGGVGFYRKVFHAAEAKRGRAVVLHFDNVESDCAVWVNGAKVGEHRNYQQRGEGRVTAVFLDDFDLDVTRAVRFGQDNLVTVRVYDTGVPLPWDRPDSGGITGQVWVEYFARDYFQTTLVTAPYGADEVHLRCAPAPGKAVSGAVRVEVRPWESSDYAFPGSPKRAYAATVNLPKPRDGWVEFTVDAPGILPWDIDEPNLYELRILDRRGHIMAHERFGVRTFRAQGRRFVLNGKPVYLFGKNTGELIEGCGLRSKEAANFGNGARRQFQAKRAANFTSQRVHTGPAPRLAYYLCDEVGLMVRDEWTPSALQPLPRGEQVVDYLGTHDVSASFTADRKAFLPALADKLRHWIQWHYNSPCVVTWSAGNEMAAGDANVRTYLELLHDFLLANDPLKRPYAPASGLHWERGDPELRHKPLPAGYLDYHNYRMIDSRWIAGATDMNHEVDDLDRIYGGIRVPLVNGEWLAHGGLDNRLCYIDPSVFDAAGQPVVGKYVSMIRDAKALRKPSHHRISRELLARIAVGGCRIARSYLDDAKARADCYHLCVELFRRDCPREVGYSIHGWNPFVHQVVDAEAKRVSGKYGGPEFDALEMAQQPLIAIPDFWDKHAFAGRAMRFTVHVLNWSRTDFHGSMRTSLCAADGTQVSAQSTEIPRLAVGERQTVPTALDVPSAANSGHYRLSLDLLSAGQIASHNSHHVLIANEADFPPIKTSKTVALYDKHDGPHSTAAFLEANGVAFERRTALDHLRGVHVLIIGKESVDAVVSKNAAAIRAFVESGGRLIAFRQALAAAVPWAPALSFENCGPVPNADPIAMAHPALSHVPPREFSDWGPDHVVYSHWIAPLGANVLVAGASPRTGFAHTNPADFGMAVAEFGLGKGACLLCQLRIEENFRTDSAARAVGHGLLRYALDGPWPVDRVPVLEGDTGGVADKPLLGPDEVRLVRLRKFVNRSVSDTDGSGWMGFRKGLEGLPLGRRVFGHVPFEIDSKGMAVVLGATPKQPKVFPAEVQGIPVWAKVKKLYFLHTATYVTAADGDEIVRYVIHYGRSHQETFVARSRTDIADWHKPKSHANAAAVWSSGSHGIYLAEWDNPRPERKISTIDIVAGKQAYIGVLGITGMVAK